MGLLARGVLILLAALGMLSAAAPARIGTTNPIQAENAKPGSRSWEYPPADDRAIEGYLSEVSAAPRDTIQFHVSTTPPARYRIELYRLGWYAGAGARLVACVPGCAVDEAGSSYPVPSPDANGEVAPAWPVTDSLRIGSSWVSGYYLAKLHLTSGPGAGSAADVPLIVRAGAGSRSAILVQAPVNTWQAYNDWGGKSLYRFNSTAGVSANHVSFDRPYEQAPGEHSLWSLYEYELPLVRFLERYGYDVSYTSDVDIDRDPGELLRHRLVISAGHDEYWTKAMRDGFELARNLGTNLLFAGANDAYWQVRYEDGGRTVVGYKDSSDPEPDPALRTIAFRSLVPPRPECELIGVGYQSTSGSSRIRLDYTVAAPANDPWFAGTGLAPGTILPDLVGYEWDSLVPDCAVPRPTVLFHWQGVNYGGATAMADAVRYRADSGARVFSAGSLQFAWALDAGPDVVPLAHLGPPIPGVEHFFRNALADLIRPGPPLAVKAVVGAGVVRFSLSDPDPRVRFLVYRRPGLRRFLPRPRELVLRCTRPPARCADRVAPGSYRYAVVAADAWGFSAPAYPVPVTVAIRR